MTFFFSNPSSANISVYFKQFGFIILFFICGNMYSQRENLDGRISASEDVDVEGINIQNLSSQKGTVTDENGRFSIAVRLNDTLSVSAIHIQSRILIIGMDQMVARKIAINLSEKMNELPTVTLRRPLTGYIGTDAGIIKTKDPVTATSSGLPNADFKKLLKIERQIYSATDGPVDLIVNLISGRTKMLKNRLEAYRTNELTLSLLDKFPQTYFTDELQIEKFKVYSFLFFCEDDADYKKTMKGNTMEIIHFLKRKSKEYKNEREK